MSYDLSLRLIEGPIRIIEGPIEDLIFRLISLWLFLGMSFGLIFGLIGGIIFGLIPSKIKPVETLTFSWKKSRNGLIRGFIFGLGSWLFFRLIKSVSFGFNFLLIEILMFLLIERLIEGLSFGLSFSLIGGVINGLSGAEIDFKNYPNQGIKESVKNAIILSIALTSILIVIRLFIQPIIEDQIFLKYAILRLGISMGVIIIGLPAIQHFCLRIVLCFSGYIPWNYSRFLDYATNRLFLQRVGGGYRFIHRLLQEHFAQIYIE